MVEVRDVVLNVNDALVLNLQLKVAIPGEDVSVVAEAARISTSPAVATVVNRQFVQNLPLNGRTIQSLIGLTPGVVFTAASSTSPGQFSVNGQRSNANYFTVDGVSANVGAITDPNFALSPGQETRPGSVPAVNAVGETHGLHLRGRPAEEEIQDPDLDVARRNSAASPAGRSRSSAARAPTSTARASCTTATTRSMPPTGSPRPTACRKRRSIRISSAACSAAPSACSATTAATAASSSSRTKGSTSSCRGRSSTDVPGPTIRRMAAPGVRRRCSTSGRSRPSPRDPVTLRARFNGGYSDTNTVHATEHPHRSEPGNLVPCVRPLQLLAIHVEHPLPQRRIQQRPLLDDNDGRFHAAAWKHRDARLPVQSQLERRTGRPAPR